MASLAKVGWYPVAVRWAIGRNIKPSAKGTTFNAQWPAGGALQTKSGLAPLQPRATSSRSKAKQHATAWRVLPQLLSFPTAPAGEREDGGSRKEISPQGDIGRPSARYRSGGRSPARQATVFGARPPSSWGEAGNQPRESWLIAVASLPAAAGTRLDAAKLRLGAASKRGGARRMACRAG